MTTCPTCGASGDQQCVRGRKPNGGQGITGAIWLQQIPFPEGHDSRRSAAEQVVSLETSLDRLELSVSY